MAGEVTEALDIDPGQACIGAVWETVGGAAAVELCDRRGGRGSAVSELANVSSHYRGKRWPHQGKHIREVAACVVKPSRDHHRV